MADSLVLPSQQSSSLAPPSPVVTTDSILSSSTKGWSPLRINKRDSGVTSNSDEGSVDGFGGSGGGTTAMTSNSNSGTGRKIGGNVLASRFKEASAKFRAVEQQNRNEQQSSRVPRRQGHVRPFSTSNLLSPTSSMSLTDSTPELSAPDSADPSSSSTHSPATPQLSPSAVRRRQSNSFSHLRSNSLVSNSVFKQSGSSGKEEVVRTTTRGLGFGIASPEMVLEQAEKGQRDAQAPIRSQVHGGRRVSGERPSSPNNENRDPSPSISSLAPSLPSTLMPRTERKVSNDSTNTHSSNPAPTPAIFAPASTDLSLKPSNLVVRPSRSQAEFLPPHQPSPNAAALEARRRRQSSGREVLGKKSLVSSSPFLQGVPQIGSGGAEEKRTRGGRFGVRNGGDGIGGGGVGQGGLLHSKRIKGPREMTPEVEGRLSGGSGGGGARKIRKKKKNVTWADEEEVLEFETEWEGDDGDEVEDLEMEEEGFYEDEDEEDEEEDDYGELEDVAAFASQPKSTGGEQIMIDHSFDQVEEDPEHHHSQRSHEYGRTPSPSPFGRDTEVDDLVDDLLRGGLILETARENAERDEKGFLGGKADGSEFWMGGREETFEVKIEDDEDGDRMALYSDPSEGGRRSISASLPPSPRSVHRGDGSFASSIQAGERSTDEVFFHEVSNASPSFAGRHERERSATAEAEESDTLEDAEILSALVASRAFEDVDDGGRGQVQAPVVATVERRNDPNGVSPDQTSHGHHQVAKGPTGVGMGLPTAYGGHSREGSGSDGSDLPGGVEGDADSSRFLRASTAPPSSESGVSQGRAVVQSDSLASLYSLPELDIHSPMDFGAELGMQGKRDPVNGSVNGRAVAGGSINRSGSLRGGRPRITREGVMASLRRKKAEAARADAEDGRLSTTEGESRTQPSPSPSSSQEFAEPRTYPVEVKTHSESATPPAKVIAARPAMKARATTLSSSMIPTLAKQRGGKGAGGAGDEVGSVIDEPLSQEQMETMESALDRLARGVGIRQDIGDVSVDREPAEDEDEGEEASSEDEDEGKVVRHTMDKTLMPPPSTVARRSASNSSADSAVSAMSGSGGTAAREAAIIQRRRSQRAKEGRPPRRRSLSTGDADRYIEEEIDAVEARNDSDKRHTIGVEPGAITPGVVLDVAVQRGVEAPFADGLRGDLDRVYQNRDKRYRARERSEVIYANDGKISSLSSAGDIDHGRAWRRVRRVSDMDEYQRQMKEFRQSEDSKKRTGKAFVKLTRIEFPDIPIPSQPTYFFCVLDNGIAQVATPNYRLAPVVQMDAEFELIQHKGLTFHLTFRVRTDAKLDPHLQRPPPALPAKTAPPPPPSRGIRSLFGSPKKASRIQPPTAPVAAPSTVTPLLRHIAANGDLAVAKINFDEVAELCFGTPKVGHYPCVQLDAAKVPKARVGTIELMMYNLPPLPTLKASELPASVAECITGMDIARWHQNVWFEGVLTQLGGDCATWRRRQMRCKGAQLLAFNDVTKSIQAVIELSRTVALVDCQQEEVYGPAKGTYQLRRSDSEDDLCSKVDRSFQLIFDDESEITFFTDTDEQKRRWMRVLNDLVGKKPARHRWADFLLAECETRAAAKAAVVSVSKAAGAAAKS